MWVAKDKHKTDENRNYVYATVSIPIKIPMKGFDVSWESGEILDGSDWLDMPAGTCVEITWATMKGKRADDDEPLTMEWLASVVEWESKHISERGSQWFVGDGVQAKNYGGETMITVCGSRVRQIKTRGQFRALCKALGIDVKEGV